MSARLGVLWYGSFDADPTAASLPGRVASLREPAANSTLFRSVSASVSGGAADFASLGFDLRGETSEESVLISGLGSSVGDETCDGSGFVSELVSELASESCGLGSLSLLDVVVSSEDIHTVAYTRNLFATKWLQAMVMTIR